MSSTSFERKTKIVLISPPLHPHRQAGSLKEIVNVLAPLGIGYLASVLEKDGFEVKIIDLLVEGQDFNQLVSRLSAQKPAILGFTATILTMSTAIFYAQKLRPFFPNTLFVIGGAQLSCAPEETMNSGCFDVGCLGEGELTFLELAQQIRDGALDLDSVEGIVYKNGESIRYTEPRPYIKDLDTIPFPARHLYPTLERYNPLVSAYRNLPQGHAITSRGCPYQCIFCDRKVFGNRFRAHSPQYVVDEMKELVKVNGAREIRFFDDTFTLNEKRAFGICEEILRRGLKVPWSILTRVDRVSQDLLRALKEAGCWQVLYGLESGVPEVLKRVKKGTTLEQAKEAVRWSKEVGLSIRGTFVLGLPGETPESLRRTIDFAKELDIDYATFFALVLYPGSELYDIAKREGKVRHFDFRQYSPIIDVKNTRLNYVPDNLTEEELKEAVHRGYEEFYLRPRYVLKKILSVRNTADFAQYWRGFKTLLGI